MNTHSAKSTDNGGMTATNTRPLSSKAAELLQDRTDNHPCWVRSPKIGPEHYSGFSRAKLYELAGTSAIRSVSIRQPGQIKGTRLFNLASILAFIEKCEQGAADEAAKTTTGETVKA
jgi:hypothetical protein